MPKRDVEEEARSLGYYIEALCKQGNFGEAERALSELKALAASTTFSEQARFRFENVLAMDAVSRRDLDTAIQIFQGLLSRSKHLEGQGYVLTRRWLATCLYYKREFGEARRLFWESLHDAAQQGDQRSVNGNIAILLELLRGVKASAG
ncbi:MAG: hypothetical protein WCP31_05310 [Chloroflexales bacterium]